MVNSNHARNAEDDIDSDPREGPALWGPPPPPHPIERQCPFVGFRRSDAPSRL
ncbi:hypothetical protein KILIM_044_00040 [Kineosphaera limosa NBRC 100340]|uniref:Uncharacterized protein n=1 Tax=Kineosphaera limosa NBRC 100340 TaxID=1184609 RepID=K6WBK2_9MICO|nr:hypothetical protein KILIM_044_00040 [Kineosphaera limosa NBRC 100340]